MTERMTCSGSMETGSPIAAGDGVARYLRSVAELHDSGGNVVGWVYLAADQRGAVAEYVQANKQMSEQDRGSFRIRLTSGSLSSIALLAQAVPRNLTVAKCSPSRE